jgi:peptidoglycan/xylan/chitin deacetylase (PgdA/CDA1 family)
LDRLSNLPARVSSRYQRTAAKLLFRRRIPLVTDTPLISFTFDDFPRSALFTGGAILETIGARATYYVSLGLIGTTAPTGKLFVDDDIDTVIERGHELGCHTYHHRHSWNTGAAEFNRSVAQNQAALAARVPGRVFSTLSYPISPPRPETKRTVGRSFLCCRGGGQTFNSGTVDLNYVAAFFIEQSRDSPQRILDIIEKNRADCGWLVFATHDVTTDPTPYGCTPTLFERVVGYAVDSGAKILPVAEVCEVLQRSADGRVTASKT